MLWSLYTTEESFSSSPDFPPYTANVHNIYIYNEIVGPNQYSEVFNVIRSCKLGDVVNIFINSCGGDLCTLVAFISAIEQSEAVTICHVDGIAFSGACILAFAGQELVVSEYANLMIHNIQSRVGMDAANIDKFIKSSKDVYRNMLKRYCFRVVSDADIEDILDHGKEVYLTGKECIQKIKEYQEAHPEDKE